MAEVSKPKLKLRGRKYISGFWGLCRRVGPASPQVSHKSPQTEKVNLNNM